MWFNLYIGTEYMNGHKLSIAPEITSKKKKIMRFREVIHQLRRTILRYKKGCTMYLH